VTATAKITGNISKKNNKKINGFFYRRNQKTQHQQNVLFCAKAGWK